MSEASRSLSRIAPTRLETPPRIQRVTTLLELLFDLTFVIGFGIATSQFVHPLAEGHYSAGPTGFGLASFAICSAWVNFSGFGLQYRRPDVPSRHHGAATALGFAKLSKSKAF